GRGVVDPPDDFRGTNPPSNPELLEALTDAFLSHGGRLKPTAALILKSDAFQRSSRPTADQEGPMAELAEANFARAVVRPLPAESLLDAVDQALDAPTEWKNKEVRRAVQLPGVAFGDRKKKTTDAGGAFLRVFGKPSRLLSCECERGEGVTLGQSLQMMNGELVRRKLELGENRLDRLVKEKDAAAVVDELYLATLSRRPSDAERQAAAAHLAVNEKNRRAALEDVAWALLNSKEFLLRH
ncbi:MAG: DUF1553 domain-containing protein, partial [Planctomycetia bacterium]